MAKKAFLVSFLVRTRVIVDVELENDPNIFGLSDEYREKITMAAKERIMHNEVGEYLCEDNIDEIELDEECPYDTEYDD